MKVKKALALLLALVLTVGLLPGRALAADDDEFTTVNSLDELFIAMDKGIEKIKLGRDITSNGNLPLDKKVTIDLDGHTWRASKDTHVVGTKDGGNVTIQNGKVSVGISMLGGSMTLKGLEIDNMVNCNGGKLVSMEDCIIAGGNGDNYPQGVYVREDSAVGTIKNCTINLTGNERPMPLVVEGGSIDTIEGCTITATNKGTENFFYAVDISDGGSVGTIKDCTITANGKNYCVGIDIRESASVKSIEGCTITVKNTAAGDEHKFDDGIVVAGRLGMVKECAITARSSISNYGKVDEISGCILNAEYDCISAQGSIGSILSNTMTATGTYGRGVEVTGSVGTVAYNNVVKAPGAFITLHEGGQIKLVNGNTGDSDIYIAEGGEISTISSNVLVGVANYGTIALLGSNAFEEDVINEGTIKKTDDSSPVDSLDKSKWYYDAMAYAYDKNLTFGIPDNQFNPDDKLTRSMLTQMLWNMEEWPASKIGTFTDVESGAWYRNSVSWAADEEIVTGYTDGSFKPDNNITREQVATILYRYVKNSGGDVSKKADLSGYADASSISAYAREAMQ